MVKKRQILKKTLIPLAHIAAWSLFIFYPFLSLDIRILEPLYILKPAITGVVLAAVFYLNIYVLIPKYFARNHYLIYFSLVILMLMTIYLSEYLANQVLFSIMDRNPLRMMTEQGTPFHDIRPRFYLPDANFMRHDSLPGFSGLGQHILQEPGGPFGRHFLNPFALRKTLSSGAIVLALGGFFRMSKEWTLLERQQKDLQKSRLDAELSLLKSQINPHFLFNTLNSLYSLAHMKSEYTETAILKLSQMMRYMIYEAGADLVPLSEEILYLENYVELQKLRLSGKVPVRFEVKKGEQDLMIAPVLFIVFVENAFKHGVSYAQPSEITIKLTVTGRTIEFEVRNFISPSSLETQYKGIGLDNVRKRLELIYPGRHELTLTQKDNLFIAYLKTET